MKLTSLYTNVPDYIEFAWICTPDTAAQTVPDNTITTLILNTEVADTGSLVSAPSSNQFTLPSGTYYCEAEVFAGTGNTTVGCVLGLYDVTNAQYITRSGSPIYSYGVWSQLSCQFNISASTTFRLTFLSGRRSYIHNGAYDGTVISNATANADQRTTIKLWKLK